MGKNRVEAFSDGVMAILITIMVLEIKIPHAAGLHELATVLPALISYLLSFVFIGIYWNNHHHLFHAVQHVNGQVLWANLHLLFWLSLIPAVNYWIGDSAFSALSVASYGCVLLLAGIAYFLLTRSLVSECADNPTLAAAIGNDAKGKISLAIYAVGIPCAFLNPWIGYGLYVLVAAVWLVPDRRIERTLTNKC